MQKSNFLLDLPDGWYEISGDGLPGDTDRRISGWGDIYRYFHFAFVKDGLPIYLGGSGSDRRVWEHETPVCLHSHYPNEYMVAAEKQWKISILSIMSKTYPIKYEDCWKEDLVIEV